MQVEITDEEMERLSVKAQIFAQEKVRYSGEELWETLYNLERENLKLYLIISKLTK